MEWIDIEKELPPYDTDVLLWYIFIRYDGKATPCCRVGFLIQQNGKDMWFIDGHKKYFIKEHRVTHWQPLPEPPKQ